MLSEVEKEGRKPGLWAVFSLTIFTALSTATGFFRELVVAFFFGTTAHADAFAVSFFYYEFFYSLVLGGLGALSIVPYLARMQGRGEEEQGKRIVNTIVLWFGILALCLVVAAILFAGELIGLTMPGLSQEQFETTAGLIRVCAIGIIPLVIGLLLAAKLQAYYRFNLTPLGRMAQNLGIVVTTLTFVWFWGVLAAGVGLIVGAVCLCVLMLWATRGDRPAGFSRLFDGGILELLKLMVVPLLLTVMLNYVLAMLEFFFLAPLGEGMISGFRYGRRLLAIFAGLGYSIQTVYFARAAREGEVNGDPTQQISLLAATIRDSTSILAPASALLGLVATPLVSLLFQRGSFCDESSFLTSTSLCLTAFGLSGINLYGIFVRAGILLRRYDLSLLMALFILVSTFVILTACVPVWGYVAVVSAYPASMLAVSFYGYLSLGSYLVWPNEYKHAGFSALADLFLAMASSAPAWILSFFTYSLPPFSEVDSIIRIAYLSGIYIFTYSLLCMVLGRVRIFSLIARMIKRQ